MKKLDHSCWFASGREKEIPNTVFHASRPAKIAIICGHSDEYYPLAKHTIYENKKQYCEIHGYDLHIVRSIRFKYIDHKSHASGFSWSRMEEMLDLVESGMYEWVYCVGADTLITNLTIPLERIIGTAETQRAMTTPLPVAPVHSKTLPPAKVIQWQAPKGHRTTGKKHLLICGECLTSIQADSFLVRGSKEGAAYLKDILAQYELYKHHQWVENQTMIDLREKHGAITKIIPAWMMNAYDCSRFYHVHPRFKLGLDMYGNRMDWKLGDFLIHWPAASLQERLAWLPRYQRQIVTPLKSNHKDHENRSAVLANH